MIARLTSTFACDFRLQMRNGFYYAAAAVAILTIVVLRLLPVNDTSWLLPVMIVNNLIVNGFYFMSGLVLLEKAEGSLEAQIVTPLRGTEYLAAKAGTLALLSLVENFVIAAAAIGFDFRPDLMAAGIVWGTTLYVMAGFIVAARYDGVNTFLMPSIGYMLLLSLPLLAYFDVGQGTMLEALLFLHPLQPTLVLLRAAVEPVSAAMIGYALVAGAAWVAVFAWGADRSFRRFVVDKVHDADLRPRQTQRRFAGRLAIDGKLVRRLGVLRSLGPIDAHSIGRDAMLRWMIVVPFIMALAIRLVMPTLLGAVESWLGIDIAGDYRPLMGYMVLLIVPYFWGAVIGFLLLDQRDEQTMTALLVTPLSLRAYLLYRLLMPAVIAAATTVVVMPITGLYTLPWWGYPVVAVSAAPLAPLTALALAALAQNKVQGLALMKAAGVVLVPPLVAYFLPAVWQPLFALFPTWWPAQALWLLEAGGRWWVAACAGGLLYQAGLLALLVRRFDRTMHM